jgi:hypothetical protein
MAIFFTILKVKIYKLDRTNWTQHFSEVQFFADKKLVIFNQQFDFAVEKVDDLSQKN